MSLLNNTLIPNTTHSSSVTAAVGKEIIMQSPSPLNHLPNYFPSQEKELTGSLTVENIAKGRNLEMLISRASERVNNPHC